MDIGKFIEKHRKLNGYKSQRQLGAKSGISAATISRIESNVQRPSPETLKELSKYLPTTAYGEMMTVAGYWNDNVTEIDITDVEVMSGVNLTLDGKEITNKELKGIIAFLRSYRELD